jgi:uncharacterized protein
VDEAGLLNDSEKAQIQAELIELSNKHRADIVIVTVQSIGDVTPMEYADDYFDYNGYGRGPNHDGLLLLISMEERDWWISTTGSAIRAFTDAGIAFIGDEMIAAGLSSGDYASAFSEFARWVDLFYNKAAKGEPFDLGRMPKTVIDLLLWTICGLVVGFLLALAVTTILKGKLKTVRIKEQASDYIRPGSMQVASATEEFLHRNVVAVPRAQASSSGGSGGGGSSIHIGSSGSSHGGGGGKF